MYKRQALLNKHKDADFIYSDEDKLDLRGERCEPHFKSDFAPDKMCIRDRLMTANEK